MTMRDVTSSERRKAAARRLYECAYMAPRADDAELRSLFTPMASFAHKGPRCPCSESLASASSTRDPPEIQTRSRRDPDEVHQGCTRNPPEMHSASARPRPAPSPSTRAARRRRTGSRPSSTRAACSPSPLETCASRSWSRLARRTRSSPRGSGPARTAATTTRDSRTGRTPRSRRRTRPSARKAGGAEAMGGASSASRPLTAGLPLRRHRRRHDPRR